MKLILAIIFTILILDFLWLGVIAKEFYKSELGDEMSTPPRWAFAGMVYVLLVVGMYLFVFNNALATSKTTTILLGATFGLVVYGVYDFTNYAILKDWPIKVVLVDVLWGTFLGAITAFVGYFFKG